MEFVPDEWLLDWLVPGSSRRADAIRFLDKLEQKQDKLVVRYKSPFTAKLFSYVKRYQTDNTSRFGKLIKLILLDSTKVELVYEHKIQSKIELGGIPVEDRYLVEVAASGPNRIILTTDEVFYEAVRGSGEIEIRLMKDFLPLYLSQ